MTDISMSDTKSFHKKPVSLQWLKSKTEWCCTGEVDFSCCENPGWIINKGILHDLAIQKCF